jgi:alpha-N-arabinofuranosidase
MYQVHQDATRLRVDLQSPKYEHGGKSMPAVSVSASRDKDGVVHVSLVNAHATSAVNVSCEIPGVKATAATGRILTADKLDAHNSFDAPEDVKPADFDAAKIADGKLTVELPAHSVVVLTLE